MHSTTDTDYAELFAKNLSCTRGENLLFENLDLEVNLGQCLHLIGPNGSGKTSLLRILCGLNQSDAGEVRWQQKSILHHPSYTQDCFYLGHKDALKNELTAIENLRFIQSLDGVVDEDRLDDVLAQMQILQCADLPVQALSFGQRRRLAFAKLLLVSRKLWVLDEPFTGIDEKGRQLIENLCVAHLRENGSIILTHHQGLKSSDLNVYLAELDISQFSTN